MGQNKDDKTTQVGDQAPGYEVSDAKLSVPVLGGLALVVLTVVAVFLMAGMFYVLVAYHNARDEGPSPMAASRIPPQGPRLVPDTPNQVIAQAVAEKALTTRYAWVDKENGFVRIPVDRAMALIAQRGLPVRNRSGGEK